MGASVGALCRKEVGGSSAELSAGAEQVNTTMCGIAGTMNWGDREVLARMNRVQAHRGPDDSGLWECRLPDGGSIGLGSRRLAILDLSSAGRMPMSNPAGNLWITYNGEVYNFPELRAELTSRGCCFHSHTDTEVVLKLYELEGAGCLRRLNGMFAIAIADLRGSRPELFLARDHFGVKPLYYVHRGRQLGFASEVKSLLCLPGLRADLDPDSLQRYLTFLWVPEPETMFRDIFKLPAGHYAIFRDSSLNLVPYWDLNFPPAGAQYRIAEDELVDVVRHKFRSAVRRQMISDVPIGSFLSAGLDSTGIVAAMSSFSPEPVRTYTITFPRKHRVGENTLDEPEVAAAVGRQCGCRHHEIMVEPDVAELLPRLIWHMDEPVADPAIVACYLVCRAARDEVKVLLSGVGGDELFAGYRKHYAHYWANAYRRLPALLRESVIQPALLALPAFRGSRWKGLVRLARKMARSGSLSAADAFLMNSTYLDANQRAALCVDAKGAAAATPWDRHREHLRRVEGADFLNQMLYLDSKVFMPSLNLTYNDKMSMACSIEVRVPLLDRELAEFVAENVPPRLKLKGFVRPQTKYIFRKALRGMLPDTVFRRPKRGFFAPVDYWLASDLRAMVDDLLSESRLRRRGLFRPEAVRALVEEHRSGARDWSLQIWQLLTLELWMETFLDGNADEAADKYSSEPSAGSWAGTAAQAPVV